MASKYCIKKIEKNIELTTIGTIQDGDLYIHTIYTYAFVPRQMFSYTYVKLFEENNEPGDVVILGFIELLNSEVIRDATYHIVMTQNGYLIAKLYTEVGVISITDEIKQIVENQKIKSAEEMTAAIMCIVASKLRELYSNVE